MTNPGWKPSRAFASLRSQLRADPDGGDIRDAHRDTVVFGDHEVGQILNLGSLAGHAH